MGMLVNGAWTTRSVKTDGQGRFVRGETSFRDWVCADGSTAFPPEAGRYHLYVSYACPWAHRALLLHKLKGLETAVGLSVVDYFMGEDGWTFSAREGAVPDALYGSTHLRDLYVRARADFTGRVTVPVLWDRKTETIVNNESREIMRMFDTQMDAIADAHVSFLPDGLREEVDAEIDRIYAPINNGVYRAGFARSQAAYDEAVTELFDELDRIESVLSKRRYLCGDVITEADWCLFATLVRFDPVYHYHFKCNRARIEDYPNLSGYLRDLFQVPGVAETVDFGHIKKHYFGSHESINPSRLVPVGPKIDLWRPHGRGKLS